MLEAMSTEELTAIWQALGTRKWGHGDMYDAAANVTMDDWAEAVQSVLNMRGVQVTDIPRISVPVPTCPVCASADYVSSTSYGDHLPEAAFCCGGPECRGRFFAS